MAKRSNAGRRADGAKQLAFEELLYASHGTADLSQKAAALYSATTANHFWRYALLTLESEKYKVALALQRAVPAVPAKPPGVQTQTGSGKALLGWSILSAAWRGRLLTDEIPNTQTRAPLLPQLAFSSMLNGLKPGLTWEPSRVQTRLQHKPKAKPAIRTSTINRWRSARRRCVQLSMAMATSTASAVANALSHRRARTCSPASGCSTWRP